MCSFAPPSRGQAPDRLVQVFQLQQGVDGAVDGPVKLSDRLQPGFQKTVFVTWHVRSLFLERLQRTLGARQRLVELLLLALPQYRPGESPEVCLGCVVVLAIAGPETFGYQAQPQKSPKVGAGVTFCDAHGMDQLIHGHRLRAEIEDRPDLAHRPADAPELADAAHAIDEGGTNVFGAVGALVWRCLSGHSV